MSTFPPFPEPVLFAIPSPHVEVQTDDHSSIQVVPVTTDTRSITSPVSSSSRRGFSAPLNLTDGVAFPSVPTPSPVSFSHTSEFGGARSLEAAAAHREEDLRNSFTAEIEPAFCSLDRQIRKLFSQSRLIGGGGRLCGVCQDMQGDLLELKITARSIFTHSSPSTTSQENPVQDLLSDLCKCIGALLVSLKDLRGVSLPIDEEPLVLLQDALMNYSNSLRLHNYISVEEKAALHLALLHLSKLFQSASSSLDPFVEHDLSGIQTRQKNLSEVDIRLMTLATFFSAVTITGIQFTFQSNDTASQNIVNLFWFMSLACSVSATVMLLISVSWHQDLHRSRRPPFHRWFYPFFWNAPYPLTMCATQFFAIGFIVFCWSSSQRFWVSAMTTVSSSTLFVLTLYINLWSVLNSLRRRENAGRQLGNVPQPTRLGTSEDEKEKQAPPEAVAPDNGQADQSAAQASPNRWRMLRSVIRASSAFRASPFRTADRQPKQEGSPSSSRTSLNSYFRSLRAPRSRRSCG